MLGAQLSAEARSLVIGFVAIAFVITGIVVVQIWPGWMGIAATCGFLLILLSLLWALAASASAVAEDEALVFLRRVLVASDGEAHMPPQAGTSKDR